MQVIECVVQWLLSSPRHLFPKKVSLLCASIYYLNRQGNRHEDPCILSSVWHLDMLNDIDTANQSLLQCNNFNK
jgi:hypothetical protein